MRRISTKITTLKKSLSDLRSAQKKSNLIKDFEMPDAPFPSYKIASTTQRTLEDLRDIVLEDIHLLQEPIEEKKEQSEAETEAEPTPAPETESNVLENPDEVVEPEPLGHQNSPYAEDFRHRFNFTPIHKQGFAEEEAKDDLKDMTPAQKALYLAMAGEKEYMYENLNALGYTVGVIKKIEKAMYAVTNGRIHDAITILKDARKDDPQNRGVAFLLSQAQFYRVHQGQRELLPHAREAAKKSCIFTEKFDEEKLLLYRYTYVATEAAIDTEKALELMREFYLLSPETTSGKKGLKAHNGIHLKSWILFSMLPFSKWDKFEYECLENLIKHTCGGALIYLYFFRGKLISKITEREKEILTPLYEAEQGLALCKQRYDKLTQPLDTFDDNGRMEGSSKLPWTMYGRYLRLFLSVAPIPRWDEVLMNMSLDARKFEEQSFPLEKVKGSGLINCSYWSTWGLSITPYQDTYTSGLIPIQKIVEEHDITKELDDMFQTMLEVEEDILPDDGEKEETLTHMPSYAYESFMQIGSKESLSFRAPREPFYISYYRAWCNDPAPEQIPSEILRAQAEKGGFTCLEEAISFFNGASKILPDPVHGLEARVENVKRYLEKLEKAEKNKGEGGDLSAHFKEFWWLYFGIIPIAVITFIIIIVAGSGGNACQSLFVIIGVLIGGAALAMSLFKDDGKK